MARLKNEDLTVTINVEGVSDTRKKMEELGKAIQDQTSKLKGLRAEQKEINAQYGKNSETAKAKAKEISQLTQAIEENRKKFDEYKNSLKLNEMTIDELQHRLRELKSKLKDTAPESTKWKEYNKDVKETSTRLKELQSQSKKTDNILKTIYKSTSGAVAMAKVAVASVIKIVQGMAKAFGKIADFEQANADLSTILGKNVTDIKQLTDSALSLGRTTEYTASQVTGLQTELAKLGFSEDQIMAMQEPVLHFATAVGASLPDAAQLAGATLRMFGLKASDTEEVLSALAVSTNKSALSFDYLQTAMSIVGPVAKTFGFDVKDTTALLGSLANSGFDASSAATATRNILLNLADTNGKLAQKLGEPVKTFPDLIAGLKKLDAQGVDLATTLELTDKRSVSAFNAFIRGADSTMELRDALEDVDGELERIADERMNTVNGSIKLLQSAWEGFILQMSGSKGVIKNVLDFITKGITKITELLFPEARTQAMADDYFKRFETIYKESGQEAAEKMMAEWEEKAIAEEDAAYDMAVTQKGRRKYVKEYDKAEQNTNALRAATQRLRALMASEAMEVDYTTNPATNSNAVAESTEQGWSLQKDESYLAAKAELTRRFNAGEIASEEEFQEQLYELEVAALTARLALNKEKGSEREQLQLTLQETIMKHESQLAKEGEKIIAETREEGFEERMAQEEKRYEEERAKFAGHNDVLEAIEKKHKTNRLKIILDAENETSRQMERDYKLERAELENHWLERLATVERGSAEEAALRRKMNSALVDEDLRYLEKLRKLLEQIVRTGEIGGIEIPEDQLKAFNLQLQEVIKKINTLKGSSENDEERPWWAGTGRGELFGVSQDQWQQFFQNLKEGKFSADDLAMAFSALGNAAQEGFQLASQAISLTNAKEDAALEKYKKANTARQESLQKRLNAGLMTQAQYDSEIQEMEEEQAAYEEELAIRQAEREKRMNLVQATINTALGVTKTLAEWGVPAGIAPAAIMSAMGAAQIAMIAATPVSGYEAGGPISDGDRQGTPIIVRRKQDGKTYAARLSPDARGFIDGPTVLVGENGREYVLPSGALDNPGIARLVSTIETARRSGNLRNLRLEAVSPAMAVSGRAEGGFVGAANRQDSDAGAVKGASATAQNDAEMKALLKAILIRLESPLQVGLLGQGGFFEAQKKYDRTRNRGKQ